MKGWAFFLYVCCPNRDMTKKRKREINKSHKDIVNSYKIKYWIVVVGRFSFLLLYSKYFCDFFSINIQFILFFIYNLFRQKLRLISCMHVFVLLFFRAKDNDVRDHFSRLFNIDSLRIVMLRTGFCKVLSWNSSGLDNICYVSIGQSPRISVVWWDDSSNMLYLIQVNLMEVFFFHSIPVVVSISSSIIGIEC